MSLRFLAVDTNILAYAEGVDRGPDDAAKITLSRTLLAESIADGTKLSVAIQSVGELFNVLVRKGRLDPVQAAGQVSRLMRSVDLIPTDEAVVIDAIELASRHRLHIFDAIIVAATAAGGCRYLLSEDMQHGFVWRGVTVHNPFIARIPRPRHG